MLQKIVLLILLIAIGAGCGAEQRSTTGVPPSHEPWTFLLGKYVDDVGNVNYQGFQKDSVALNQYLASLSSNAPDTEKWTQEQQLAYWINAYNAFTVKLIVDNYPISSIRDLDPTINIPLVHTVWHRKFFKIGGKPTSLDEIEHSILRKKFNEPRIHFAINCASYSCPPLRKEAYVASTLEHQLEQQAKQFINDEKRNKLNPRNPEVSKIFSWFTRDFTRNGTLREYLNRYADVQINEDADIDYMDYNWALNEQ